MSDAFAGFGVVEGFGRFARVSSVNLDVFVGRSSARHITGLEPLDDRNVHTAHEADAASGGFEGRQIADHETTFLFTEHDAIHVGLVGGVVHDDVGIAALGFGRAVHQVLILKPDADEQVVLARREAFHLTADNVAGWNVLFERHRKVLGGPADALGHGFVVTPVLLARLGVHVNHADGEGLGGVLSQRKPTEGQQ